MKKTLTLKDVNAFVQQKYPLIQVCKDDRGGLYLYSDDEETGLMLAGLYSSSMDVHVSTLSRWTLEGMLDNVERVMADEFRYEGDRQPVKFSYYIERITDGDGKIRCDHTDKFDEAIRMMEQVAQHAVEIAIRRGKSSVVRIAFDDKSVKMIAISFANKK